MKKKLLILILSVMATMPANAIIETYVNGQLFLSLYGPNATYHFTSYTAALGFYWAYLRNGQRVPY